MKYNNHEHGAGGVMEEQRVKSLSEMSNEELWQLFPIVIKEYNPVYQTWYADSKDEIYTILGTEKIKRINHIGSTAVPGLVSKPTVDILLEIDINSDIEDIKKQLGNNGWICMHEERQPQLHLIFNRGYTIHGFAERVYHLHVRFLGDWNELYFRDYLIAHPEVAKEYGLLKCKLMKTYEHNRDGYTEAKTSFVKEFTDMAREEFGERYKQ